ncbi:MAG TPA: hypothetical protein VIY90_12155 [Steroidobacteraceae bacterium]
MTRKSVTRRKAKSSPSVPEAVLYDVLVDRVQKLRSRLYQVRSTLEVACLAVDPDEDLHLFTVLRKATDEAAAIADELEPRIEVEAMAVQS